MIWALEMMNAGGLEGTVLGTLITPYCTGIGNLLVAFVVGRSGGPGSEVMTNSIVNNVTNMTLLIGLPAIFWTMNVLPQNSAKGKKKKRDNQRVHEINRLSLLLTLAAVLFFTGAVWALARDGKLDFGDGLVLVGMFLFWQLFHVYDVLKSNVQKNKSLDWTLLLYLAALVAAAYLQYLSIDWLDQWLRHRNSGGFLSEKNMGLLSGWLCALPNGLLALYYGWRGNPEIVYTSQVGDGHICIPLCVGIFAIYNSFHVPAVFQTGMYMLIGATVVHMFCVVVFGQLPRLVGIALVIAYGVFIYSGWLH